MTDLVQLTLGQASELIRQRSVSSAELVEANLQRIRETEPVIHAYARVFDEDARRAARELDTELAAGQWRGPLHGVPIAVKDICFVKGAPTEAGSRVMAGFVPTYDATVVRRLRAAGAIVIGKTITHEFAVGVNTPVTRTPWDLEAYPGGSSAGSGVAVTSRSAFGALGTDTGGSIRVPASINGIVGLKPTFGRVSSYGVVPLGTSLDNVGPMTRTVDDCAILLQAIAGPDPSDSASVNEPVPDYRQDIDAGASGMVVGVERDYHFYEGVRPDVRRAVDSAIHELEQQGARVVEVKARGFELMPQVGLTIMAAEASTIHRRLIRNHTTDYDQATRIQLEVGEFVPATHYLLAQRARTFLRDAVRNVFAEHRLDALLWPTLATTTVPLTELFSPRGDLPTESPMLGYIHQTFSANVLGQPALSIPCGLSDDGLPIGVQLLGRPFDEASLFRLARAYERATSWSTLQPSLPV